MSRKEKLILINFLKNGLSTRQLDTLLEYDKNKTKGWKSFGVLKRYKLKNRYKGKLFLYSNSQCISLVKKLEEFDLEDLIEKNSPKIVQKYSNSKVFAEDEKIFYQVMSGETRNIIQSFFAPLKKTIGTCQLGGCDNRDLDTVHLGRERPEIFMDSARELAVRKSGGFEYPIMKVMAKFLKSHQRKGAVCFLCKKHHLELHRLEKMGGSELKRFKENIAS